ncbi:ankyrin repeat domain-containing protein [Pseudomonadota bacterium]
METDESLISAARRGDLTAVRRILVLDVNYSDEHGWTALMYAVKGGHDEVVKYLMRRGAHFDQPDSSGWTPLMRAAREGHNEIVQIFIAATGKTDVNYSDEHGWTALLRASQKRHTEVIETLIEAGAEVDQANQRGETALMFAAQKRDIRTVRVLIKAKATVDQVDGHGRTALMFAAQEGDMDSVKALVEARASTNKADEDGMTAAMYAARRGNMMVLEYLLENTKELSSDTARAIYDRLSKRNRQVPWARKKNIALMAQSSEKEDTKMRVLLRLCSCMDIKRRPWKMRGWIRNVKRTKTLIDASVLHPDLRPIVTEYLGFIPAPDYKRTVESR